MECNIGNLLLITFPGPVIEQGIVETEILTRCEKNRSIAESCWKGAQKSPSS